MSKGLYGSLTLQPATTTIVTTTDQAEVDLLQFMGENLSQVKAMAFVLDVTAAATAVDDVLDVYVQTLLDGTNWVDVVHFTQILGNGGAKRYFAKVERGTSVTEFEVGSALTETNARDLFGRRWRVRWTLTDAGADNASFTFSVAATPM